MSLRATDTAHLECALNAMMLWKCITRSSGPKAVLCGDTMSHARQELQGLALAQRFLHLVQICRLVLRPHWPLKLWCVFILQLLRAARWQQRRRLGTSYSCWQLIAKQNCDILCLQETFLPKQDLAKLNSFSDNSHGAGESTTDLTMGIVRGRIAGGVANPMAQKVGCTSRRS